MHSETYCGRYKGRNNYYPAYITEQQYEHIQSISVSKTSAHVTGVYVFSGLLKCPVCGRNLTGFVKKQKLKDGTQSLYRRYRCYAKFYPHSGPCISESVVEKYMIDHLWPELQNCIYNASLHQKEEDPDKSIQIKSEMDRLNKLYQKGRISDEYYEEQYELLEAKLLLLDEPKHPDSLDAYRAIEKEITVNWLDIYQSLDLNHKQAFWKRIIKEIYIDKETHKVSGFSFLI